MKSILDPSFKYAPSYTDVRKTFAKALREERLKAKQRGEQKRVVVEIRSFKMQGTRRSRFIQSLSGHVRINLDEIRHSAKQFGVSIERLPAVIAQVR